MITAHSIAPHWIAPVESQPAMARIGRRTLVLALLLILGVAVPAAETMHAPPRVDTRPGDPIIPAPGMGWIAYCWEGEIRNPSPWLPDLLERLQEGPPEETGQTGHCRLIYIRLLWRDFEELKETGLKTFLESIQAFNATEPDVLRQMRVFLAVTFTNSCPGSASSASGSIVGYPEGWGIDDQPPYIEDPCSCDDCPASSDILDTYLLDYCLDPEWDVCDQSAVPPYNARYQLRELNYFNPEVLPAVVAPWNQALADFVARFDCIAGVHAGFMGNWGQNHLPMFTEYGTAEPPRDWVAFRDNVRAWFADFQTRMSALPRGVDQIFSENYHWEYADRLCHMDGRLTPSQSIVTDMFGIAREHGFILHWGKEAVDRLPDPAYDLAFRETIRDAAPFFSEWDSNESLEDEFAFYPNYMQLNMCGLPFDYHIGCWGLQDAVWSMETETYQQHKNRLGYRFQVSGIRRDRNSAGGYVRIKIRNIGAGFCVNPVRLSLWECDAGGQEAHSAIDIPSEDIRHLRTDDLDELEVEFSLPGFPPIPGGGSAWKVSLEVYDHWTNAYLPVKWSNLEAGGVTDILTVFPLLGDLDGDSLIRAADLNVLAGYLAENSFPALADPGCADYNGDSRIDLRDLLLMKRRVD